MSYTVTKYNARLWIKSGERLLAGYAANELRSYLFPLYTPNGALVLQEAPPDHPHHQGLWCGLEVDGHDLWNAGSFGKARHRQALLKPLNEIEATVTATGVQLAHAVRWETVDGQELLQEVRTVQVRGEAEYTLVQWRSTFSHPEKATRLGQTKEAGIAIRVPPHWETALGGRIRNAQGALGEAATFDQSAAWVNVEGRVVGETLAGVVLAPTADSEVCPWFTRDYGIQVYNPARHRAITLAPGERLTWAVNVLAYDGARSVAEIDAFVRSCIGE
ncbi:MAG: DUF6807 family protein [Caldilineaceae bacterium]